MQKGKIAQQKINARKNPKAELTFKIFEKYNLKSLSFVMNQKIYRFRENFIKGDNGEFIAYEGFSLTIQQGTNPIEANVCRLLTEQELRAIYKIITKQSIDTRNKIEINTSNI